MSGVLAFSTVESLVQPKLEPGLTLVMMARGWQQALVTDGAVAARWCS